MAVAGVTREVSVVRVLVRDRRGRVNGAMSRLARGRVRSKMVATVVVEGVGGVVAGRRWADWVWRVARRRLRLLVSITVGDVSAESAEILMNGITET